MSVHSSAYFWNGDTLVLHIFLQPRASQNEWAGRHNGRIRLRVTAAPVDNQANRECVKFISKSLKTAKTNVKVVLEVKPVVSKLWKSINLIRSPGKKF
ncbi:MAG: YggU family protein [SAR324 cluster bacterium]|uniref:YggU family protein n=1 Tax=SAR324 cluster bacterium TaxID=2024889 RepID=A0A432G584_9DELT|nr:MAG: YggU family protein [SAR324 cluster bacterium]